MCGYSLLSILIPANFISQRIRSVLSRLHTLMCSVLTTNGEDDGDSTLDPRSLTPRPTGSWAPGPSPVSSQTVQRAVPAGLDSIGCD